MTDPVEWQCPECGGQWLHSLVFQHRVTCPLLASLDATQYRDRYLTTSPDRYATAAEIALFQVMVPFDVSEKYPPIVDSSTGHVKLIWPIEFDPNHPKEKEETNDQ